MSILSFLPDLVTRSMFLRGEHRARRASPLSKIVILSVLVFLSLRGGASPYIVIASSLILYVLSSSYAAMTAALLLSLLVSAWFSVTGGLTSLALGGGFVRTAETIALRSFTYSILGQAAVHCISPWSASDILSRASPRAASYPMLIWRLSPQALRDSSLAIDLHRAKGDGISGAAASIVMSLIERRDSILWANYHRLERGALMGMPRGADRRADAAMLLLAASLLVLYFILGT